MPTIDQLADKTKKKFVKSEYRPWNYMEEIEKESNENQLEINKKSEGEQIPVQVSQDKQEIEIKEPSIINQLAIGVVGEGRSSAPETNKAKSKHADFSIDETTLDTIFRLTGHQKKIFMFIFERCVSRAMLSSGVIKGEVFTEITGTTIKMVKTSIQRLERKALVQRERGKTGRGGFYMFSLTEIVRNAAIEYKRMVGNEDQIAIKKESSGDHIGINKKSLSSDKKSNLPDEWMNINISPLEEIGFNHHHLLDIYETQLADPQMVQESILHFAYGIEYESEKYKQYNDFLNVLIGRLRKGKPWFEQSYRSHQEIAQEKLLEFKKAEIERKKKLIDDAFKLAMSEWESSLTNEQKDQITRKSPDDLTPYYAKLSAYFKNNIWPSIQGNYIVVE
jgi:DNA-binding MarR family transcriptional regulator